MKTLHISKMAVQKSADTSRFTCEVGGIPVWYESSDLSLQPEPVALACALVIPCLHTQSTLEISEPVCATWYSNIEKLMEFLRESWGVLPIQILANTCITDGNPPAASAQCFSGGVDSFYTLVTSEPRPNYLVYVDGHGIPLSSESTLSQARQRIERVASAFGSRVCVLRTNIWSHPAVNAHQFADTHASQLAAFGHLLGRHIGSITIPPGWHKSYPYVSGSHWYLDPLWSSRTFRIIAGEGSLTRADRVRAIANERIVQENLRVCFDHANQAGNCSRCEKCVRTMLNLHQCGKLAAFTVFDTSVPIWDLIDQIPFVRNTQYYYDALERGVERKVEAALKRLLRRSYVSGWSYQKLEEKIRLLEAMYKPAYDDYPKLQEGLNNALHHYQLLQESFNELSADYYDIVGRLPVKGAVRTLRKAMRRLREWRKSGKHQ